MENCVCRHHRSETIDTVCLSKLCCRDPLLCGICKQISHNDHKTIPLDEFIGKTNQTHEIWLEHLKHALQLVEQAEQKTFERITEMRSSFDRALREYRDRRREQFERYRSWLQQQCTEHILNIIRMTVDRQQDIQMKLNEQVQLNLQNYLYKFSQHDIWISAVLKDINQMQDMQLGRVGGDSENDFRRQVNDRLENYLEGIPKAHIMQMRKYNYECEEDEENHKNGKSDEDELVQQPHKKCQSELRSLYKNVEME